MFPLGHAAPDAHTRLFCLPHAGAGASAFRGWGSLLAPEIEVVPVQLPGRENRLAEPPVVDLVELVAQLAEPVRERGGDRFALFGHSMGALICYELAAALCGLGTPPVALVVSGHTPPHRPRTTQYPASLDDADLVEFLDTCGGTPEEILASKDMVELILPTLRADLAACRAYRPCPRPPLPLPVTGFVGADDPVVSQAEFAGWAELTSAGWHVERIPGGHNGMYDEASLVAATLRQVLAPAGDQRLFLPELGVPTWSA